MREFEVPTTPVEAEAHCADGASYRGHVFLPASKSAHAGPMLAEDWMNEADSFFPFKSDTLESPIILNKLEILALTVPAPQQPEVEPGDGPVLEHRQVALECGAMRLQGKVTLDMPTEKRRVLDFLNRSEPFLSLIDGDSQHLVRRTAITRVFESRT